MIKKYAFYCEHDTLASACQHCKHTVRVSNVLAKDGWTRLIETKEKQYASADERVIASEREVRDVG